ncbi:MAG: RHS repeat-associated core domain-containing protein, partial [Caldilineaceae bacterium]
PAGETLTDLTGRYCKFRAFHFSTDGLDTPEFHNVHIPHGGTSVPGSVPFGFVGGLGVRADETTRLLWMRQSWYDVSLGRFLNRDPIGLVGGLNMYAYVGNCPTCYVDPSETDPMSHSFERDPSTGMIENPKRDSRLTARQLVARLGQTSSQFGLKNE